MPDIPIIRVTRDGVTLPSAITATGEDLTIPDNDGNLTIEVGNPTGADLDFTITAQILVAGEPFPGLERTVPAGETQSFGPLPPVVYNTAESAVIVEAEAGLTFRGSRI